MEICRHLNSKNHNNTDGMMKNLKIKLKAIWMILKADGFDVATTYPTKRGFIFESMSRFGKDNTANVIHNHIGNYFNGVIKSIEETNNKIKQHDTNSN